MRRGEQIIENWIRPLKGIWDWLLGEAPRPGARAQGLGLAAAVALGLAVASYALLPGSTVKPRPLAAAGTGTAQSGPSDPGTTTPPSSASPHLALPFGPSGPTTPPATGRTSTPQHSASSPVPPVVVPAHSLAAASDPPAAFASLPQAPTALKVTPGKGWATLHWTAPALVDTKLMAYNVSVGTSPGGEAQTPVNGSQPVFGTRYTVDSLSVGTTYYFTVQAFSGAGLSPPSAEASTSVPVTPLPSTALSTPVAGMAAPANGSGYWLMDTAGNISAHGSVTNYGSASDSHPSSPFVAIVATADGLGYWEVTADGEVFGLGDARSFGSASGIGPSDPVVGLAPTKDGAGYWLVTLDGGVLTFGDASPLGSPASPTLNDPVVGITLDPATGGYWVVTADGQLFGYNAPSFGSPEGQTLNGPIVAMAGTPDGAGYWMAGSDGGVFAYGDAAFQGSAAGSTLNAPVVGFSPDQSTSGYWLVGADGGVFSFAAPYLGNA
jgi:hypothetical protein